MTTKRPKHHNEFPWFATPRGRFVSLGGLFCIGYGCTVAYFSAHTFLKNKYREIVQMYGLGVEIPIPSKVKRRIEEVLDDMDVSARRRKFIEPFTVFGFDMFHAGCTFTKSGSVIGIPSNFSYESVADVERESIVVNLDQVSWSSKAGRTLQEALVLSEDAQKFAIGREIAHVQTFYVYFHSMYPGGVATLMYAIASNTNGKLDLLKRSFSIRFILYSLVGLFGFGVWAFFQDFTTVYYEKLVDSVMCSLGEKYIKGGAEFYSKLVQRNIALRELMGEKGESLYTVTGNDQFFVRQKHWPLTFRKEFFEKKLEELKKEQKESTVIIGQKPLKDLPQTEIKFPSPA